MLSAGPNQTPGHALNPTATAKLHNDLFSAVKDLTGSLLPPNAPSLGPADAGSQAEDRADSDLDASCRAVGCLWGGAALLVGSEGGLLEGGSGEGSAEGSRGLQDLVRGQAWVAQFLRNLPWKLEGARLPFRVLLWNSFECCVAAMHTNKGRTKR